jgi:hypothetical protein
MALRRGFKADAERVAAEVRRDMGLTNLECLDPFRLATFLDIPVLGFCLRVTSYALLPYPRTSFSGYSISRRRSLST